MANLNFSEKLNRALSHPIIIVLGIIIIANKGYEFGQWLRDVLHH